MNTLLSLNNITKRLEISQAEFTLDSQKMGGGEGLGGKYRNRKKDQLKKRQETVIRKKVTWHSRQST